jgi:hypothetical protein
VESIAGLARFLVQSARGVREIPAPKIVLYFHAHLRKVSSVAFSAASSLGPHTMKKGFTRNKPWTRKRMMGK